MAYPHLEDEWPDLMGAQREFDALVTAIGVLDAVKEAGKVPAERFPKVVGRISFFVNAGIRFVEEMC